MTQGWGWGLVNRYSVGMISEGRARDKVWRRAQQLPSTPFSVLVARQ